MMKNLLQKIFFTIALFSLFNAYQSFGQSVTIYALTKTNQLISFSASAPATILATVAITGLPVGQDLVGFDTRPRTGELYAFGYNATAGTGRLYKLSTTGVLTALGAADFAINLGALTDNVGMDFNPTVDRIRILSTNKKNYRLHPDLGTLVATDTDLAYAPTDPNAAMMPQVAQLCYTNSYVAATKTTLYYLDEANGVFGRAFDTTNPNNGQIATIGSIGIALNPTDKTIDMDAAFNGTGNLIALVANTTSAADMLYVINASTGATTMVGNIGAMPTEVKDIAIAINRNVPALVGNLVYGLTTNARFVSFDAANPSIIRTDFGITGLKTGHTLVGMDVRPQDNKIYALGFNLATPADTLTTIYTLNETTGLATVFADSVRMNLGGTPNIAFDFNPVANRLRIVSAANRRNFRLNLTTTPTVVIRDTSLTYKSTDPNASRIPSVGAVAYTNSYLGATTTQLFDIDEKNKILTLQNSPNGGFLNTVAPLNLNLDTLDLTNDADIVTNGMVGNITNTAYLAANIFGGNNYDSLYILNLSGGIARVGRIGSGLGLRDIAGAITFATGIKNENKASVETVIYPNPSQASITVEIENPTMGKISLELFDLRGTKIYSELLTSTAQMIYHNIDISKLNAGIYTLKTTTTQGFGFKKVIKL